MRILIVPLLAACAAVTMPASAQTLKPGLWELLHKTGSSPQMGQGMAEMQKEMANMPPEQRKQMEAMMAGRGGQMAPAENGGMHMRICLTKEMVERNDIPASRGDCKTTQHQRTGNTLKMAFTCSKPPSKGETVVTYTSPEAFTTRTNVTTTTAGGKPESMTVEGSGKWLAADCGDVQPIQTK